MTFEFKPYSLLSASIHLLESTAKDYELGIQSKHVFPSLWSVLVMISLTPSAQFWPYFLVSLTNNPIVSQEEGLLRNPLNNVTSAASWVWRAGAEMHCHAGHQPSCGHCRAGHQPGCRHCSSLRNALLPLVLTFTVLLKPLLPNSQVCFTLTDADILVCGKKWESQLY